MVGEGTAKLLTFVKISDLSAESRVHLHLEVCNEFMKGWWNSWSFIWETLLLLSAAFISSEFSHSLVSVYSPVLVNGQWWFLPSCDEVQDRQEELHSWEARLPLQSSEGTYTTILDNVSTFLDASSLFKINSASFTIPKPATLSK